MQDKTFFAIVLTLVDWGFDLEKNSAKDLLESIFEVANLALKNQDVMAEIKENVIAIQEKRKEMFS